MCINSDYVNKFLYTLTKAELRAEYDRMSAHIDAGNNHRGNYHALMFINAACERLNKSRYLRIRNKLLSLFRRGTRPATTMMERIGYTKPMTPAQLLNRMKYLINKIKSR